MWWDLWDVWKEEDRAGGCGCRALIDVDVAGRQVARVLGRRAALRDAGDQLHGAGGLAHATLAPKRRWLALTWGAENRSRGGSWSCSTSSTPSTSTC
eukprot:3908182-Rhodomonas_salina.3